MNHLNSFHGGMFKLHAKSDADVLLYLLSHFECEGFTIHMLTQWCLLPALTSTVNSSSLFTHVHSNAFSLAARLHRCHANHSCYINNSWSFSGQTLYMFPKKVWDYVYTFPSIFLVALFLVLPLSKINSFKIV